MYKILNGKKYRLGVLGVLVDFKGKSKKVLKYDFPEPQIRKEGVFDGQLKKQFLLEYKYNSRNEIKIQEEEIKKFKWVKNTELEKFLIFPNQYAKTIELFAEFGLYIGIRHI